MFIMIVVAVFVHQLTDRLILKVDTYPLRMIMVRILELAGKLCLMPYVVITFVTAFPSFDETGAMQEMLIAAALFFSFYVFLREFSGLKHTLSDTILFIRKKVDNPSANQLSNGEMLLYNIYSFGVISRSASHYHRWKKENDKQYLVKGHTKSDEYIDNNGNNGINGSSGTGSDTGSSYEYGTSSGSSGFNRTHIINSLHESHASPSTPPLGPLASTSISISEHNNDNDVFRNKKSNNNGNNSGNGSNNSVGGGGGVIDRGSASMYEL